MTKTMSPTMALAAALSLFAATGALAQASNSQSSSGSTMMMKQTPKSDTAKMKGDAAGMSAKTDAAQTESMKSDQSADASADASMAKLKAHHRVAKNETALNQQEAETTKQLNESQAQYAQNPK